MPVIWVFEINYLVSQSSALLISATEDLLANPVSHTGRTQLLDSVKGILEGTTNILDASDEFEIRKILNSNSLLVNLLKQIKNSSLEVKGHRDYIHLLKRLAQTVTSSCQLSTKRVKDIVSDKLAADLQDAILTVTRESNTYLTGCRMVLTWPTSEEAKQVHQTSQGILEMAIERINAIVTCKDADTFYANPSRQSNTSRYSIVKADLLSEPLAEKWKRSAPDTKKVCNEFLDESRKKQESINGTIH